MKDTDKLLGFLYHYVKHMHEFVRGWIELKKEYSDELETVSNPARLAEVLRNMDDREADKLFKALLELAGISQTLSKVSELELEELIELEKKLGEVHRELEKLVKEKKD